MNFRGMKYKSILTVLEMQALIQISFCVCSALFRGELSVIAIDILAKPLIYKYPKLRHLIDTSVTQLQL